jgi:uncharacterized membrane protein
MRKQNDWNAAASQFEYFPARSAERAEAVFNTYAIAERTKVERETVAKFGGEDLSDARQASNVRPEDVGKSTQVWHHVKQHTSYACVVTAAVCSCSSRVYCRVARTRKSVTNSYRTAIVHLAL